MMKIELHQISKRYINHWVFKGICTTYEGANTYAILGANGSGKSTLLRMIAGMQTISNGTVTYELEGKEITSEQIFEYISYCAPAMDVIEEMTLKEFLSFHFQFKKTLQGWSVARIISSMQLDHAAGQYINEFSSGMKQRVKLAQAFFADTPILLLDEPCSNLDLQGVAMYQEWLQTLATDRLIIIASNDAREYPGAIATLDMQQYK
ncbi:ABC transporter ATP-binding protein [Taibaiella sp. KBW10]|uniref:ABC transporter ATP-binding protein n=1 Tax=Taibaiella sp. KBW10 TaxID=2153357 RepID=UPI000F5A6B34|nr:ATP-binding cassette domain-containing protein [Taibaiella sp. KBW10]RQO32442.1 ABC transporter ATP-binding protein [Taibaiella sp. KBW10]